jgi:hypothetical protein
LAKSKCWFFAPLMTELHSLLLANTSDVPAERYERILRKLLF